MKKILIMLVLVFSLSGCSLIPKMTFNRTTNTLPQQTSKADKFTTCKGEIKLDPSGKIVSCSNGYKSTEKLYNQQERSFTMKEKIINFLNNLIGWAFWIGLALFFLAPGVLGLLFGRATEAAGGIASKGLKGLVTGIQKGKTYVKQNGHNYTEEQKLIYQQGVDDLLKKISETITDPKVAKEINLLRAEAKIQNS